MKTAFLALVAILILGGGAAGAYFYFEQPAQASIGDDEAHQQAVEAEKADKARAASRNHEFVELAPLVLPIVDNSGVSQVVSMVVVLEVDSSSKAEKVRTLEPRLKDAYIQELYGVLNKHAALQGGVLQVNMIKARLNQISHKVLGDEVVEDVLLQVVQQRPL